MFLICLIELLLCDIIMLFYIYFILLWVVLIWVYEYYRDGNFILLGFDDGIVWVFEFWGIVLLILIII